jgi:hypothetical protein
MRKRRPTQKPTKRVTRRATPRRGTIPNLDRWLPIVERENRLASRAPLRSPERQFHTPNALIFVLACVRELENAGLIRRHPSTLASHDLDAALRALADAASVDLVEAVIVRQPENVH